MRKFALSAIICIVISATAFALGCLFVVGFRSLNPSEPTPTAVLTEIVQGETIHAYPEDADIAHCPAIDTFEPTGSYSVDDRELLPKSFSDIKYIVIEAHKYTDEKGEPVDLAIVPEGRLLTGKSTDVENLMSYNMTRLAVGGYEIGFQTDAHNGISYKFVGRVVEPQSDDDGNVITLTGNLVKMKNGKRVAEINVMFFLEDSC